MSARPLKEELEAEPEKYYGYKKFAEFVSSDGDFFALRRFDRTHCRALLALQDEIHALEERLDAIDNERSDPTAKYSNNGTFRKDRCPERKNILAELASKLGIYDNLLSAYIGLKKVPPAAPLAIANMRAWLGNRDGSIDVAETQFLDASDLISLQRCKKALFRRLLEQHVFSPLLRITRSVRGRINRTGGVTSRPNDSTSAGSPPGAASQSDPEKVASQDEDEEDIASGSDEHVDVAASFFVFIAALCMLIVPLWILPPMGGQLHKKLGTITAFLLLFLIFMQWRTVARPFEVLAATAGYAAVLIVFLQVNG